MIKEGDLAKCEMCGSYYFDIAFVLTWKTTVANPQIPEDGWAPLQTFMCKKCGHVNKEFDPLTDENKKEDRPVQDLILP